MNVRMSGWSALVGAALALLVASAESSKAQVNNYTDPVLFASQGTIAFDTTFTSFGTGFTTPGTPYTIGGVTYTSSTNLITGTGTSYAPVTELMTDNNWSPVTGTIDTTSTTYNMFGYDIGVLDRQDLQTLAVTTNLATYTYPLLSLNNGADSLSFEGFVLTNPSEYFTGFSITAQNGPGSLPGITDVELGNSNSVPSGTPEPGSFVLLSGLGVTGCLMARLKKRQTGK